MFLACPEIGKLRMAPFFGKFLQLINIFGFMWAVWSLFNTALEAATDNTKMNELGYVPIKLDGHGNLNFMYFL